MTGNTNILLGSGRMTSKSALKETLSELPNPGEEKS